MADISPTVTHGIDPDNGTTVKVTWNDLAGLAGSNNVGVATKMLGFADRCVEVAAVPYGLSRQVPALRIRPRLNAWPEQQRRHAPHEPPQALRRCRGNFQPHSAAACFSIPAGKSDHGRWPRSR